jgi:hypothetical protein
MKTEAWYKIYIDEYADVALLSFKIDNLVFILNLYCKKIPKRISHKQLGTKMLELLVLRSTYISLKDHLSNYVFDNLEGYKIDISENEILISTANRMRRIIKNFKYNTSENLKQQTHILYNKIWNTKHFTRI